MTANQSRHRSGPSQALDIDALSLEKSTMEFQYQQLDPSVDCTRLVEIDPAEDDNDAPCCKLIHVIFGEKPKYEALSYMWGDVTLRKNIYVDGKEFSVGENLWEALCYLRKRANRLRYWIDAICINQADIPERNRQLRIMPTIYMRAQMVLVWLGRKHAKYDANIWEMNLVANDEAFRARQYLSRTERKRQQVMMAKELCSDEYWGRVWIVQEIGKARKIQVCFGGSEVAWDIFIRKITILLQDDVECDGTKGPLKLERQLQEKYHYGYTLRKLLEDYENAICQDPRDKIYGFIGLAADARGFPMDYQKTLWEVWKDTMLFANRYGKLLGSDIVPFGRLAKRLLGGSSVAAKDWVAQEYSSWADPLLSINALNDPTIFILPAYIAGMIICKGPPPEQIISDLDMEDEWRAQMQQNFPEDLGRAYRDNDLLMQMLLDSETEDSKTGDSNELTLPDPRIRWRLESSIWQIIVDHKERASSKFPTAQQSLARDLESDKPWEPTSASCLYQIKRITGLSSPWKMGIVALEAQIGDLICWIEEVGKAVILRTDGIWLQIIGTAAIPIDLRGRPVDGIRNQYFNSEEKIELCMDVETAYILLT